MIYCDIAYREKTYRMYGITREDCVFKNVWESMGVFYEYQILDYIKEKNLQGTYIDLGSNVGNHSVFFASQCPCSRLIAVDPCLAVKDIFYANMSQNVPGFSFEYKQIALMDFEGTGSLTEITSDNVGNSRVIPGSDVVVSTVDITFKEVKDCTVFKIDVEGNEIAVLKGANQFLLDNSPVIVCELVDEQSYKQFEKTIEKYGYKCDGINKCPGWAATYVWERC